MTGAFTSMLLAFLGVVAGSATCAASALNIEQRESEAPTPIEQAIGAGWPHFGMLSGDTFFPCNEYNFRLYVVCMSVGLLMTTGFLGHLVAVRITVSWK